MDEAQLEGPAVDKEPEVVEEAERARLGDIVHFVDHEDKEAAAIVTHIWPQGEVTLRAFYHDIDMAFSGIAHSARKGKRTFHYPHE